MNFVSENAKEDSDSNIRLSIRFRVLFKVKIQALNDSHQIGLCVYNVIVLSAVGLTLSLLLTDQEVLMYGVTSGALILGTTLTQIVIFIPKVSMKKTLINFSSLNCSNFHADHPIFIN